MEFCQFPLRSRLLDVGCGSGATVSYLRSQFYLDVCGLDVSSRLLEAGKARDADLPLLRAKGEHLPFGSGSLDGIICECVLSLLSESDSSLREFHRTLRTDGKLILSDIYLRSHGAEENLMEQPLDGCPEGARPACSVKKILSEAGFAIIFWEDHTLLLKELAAQLVLTYGSEGNLWGGIKGTGCSGIGLSTMAAMRPGYYLLVARKK
jgi:SAM-dependent methyltransferase